MLHEKPNEDFHWKNKLEEMDGPPGDFNKEAAWGKLHERMQGKPANTKALWYWVAAACLLLAVIIPWLFLANKKENILVNTTPKKQIRQSSPSLPSRNNDKEVVIFSPPVEKKSSALPVEKNIKTKAVTDHTTSVTIVQNKKGNTAEYVIRQMAANAAAPVDTSVTIAAIFPEKKKLKVVHINELGDAVMEPLNTVGNYEHHSLQVKFINQEVYTNPPPSSGNTGFNIFKTKIAPSN